MPNVVVIAGPNGSGKSTLAPALLRDTLNIPEYVNADTIAEGLSAFAPEDASFDAERVMLGRLHDLAEERRSFAYETTLASRFYARWLSELKTTSHYRVSLIFPWLRDVDLAISRVAARVRLGGHSIPEETIRRRFDRGIKNLFELYIPIADAWQLYNAGTEPATEIATYDVANGEAISKRLDWVGQQFSNGTNKIERMVSVSNGVLGYVVQLEHIRFNVPGQATESTKDYRVTMIFRKEKGSWRIVHRQADSNMTKQAPK